MAGDLAIYSMSLDQVGVQHGTDKSSINHCYLGLYELLFAKFNRPRILEIGIQFGNSIRTWREYFPLSEVWGIDSVDNRVKHGGDNSFLGNVFLLGNAYDEQTVHHISNKTFDIIIDDGSHEPKDQAFVVEHYSKLLTAAGMLIVEDVRSKDVIPILRSALPDTFQYTVVDMTEGNSTVDSRLFICWYK